jgi:hypothetical protein
LPVTLAAVLRLDCTVMGETAVAKPIHVPLALRSTPHCIIADLEMVARSNCTHKAVDFVTSRKVLEKLVNVMLLFSILCALLCFLHSKRLLSMNVNVIKIFFVFDITANYA